MRMQTYACDARDAYAYACDHVMPSRMCHTCHAYAYVCDAKLPWQFRSRSGVFRPYSVKKGTFRSYCGTFML